jgi:glyceraldehyde-3-phosphate dehydrogenase/erythrose-4-phosphate dehydrogenase
MTQQKITQLSGKCVLLQLLNEKVYIKAINIPGFDVQNLKIYLEKDSVHTCVTLDIKIISDSLVTINGREITILNDRDAKKLNWSQYDVTYVIDTTGVYLTADQCFQHNADYG